LIREERRLLTMALAALAGEVTLGLLAPFPVKYIFDGLLIPTDRARLPGVPPDFPQEHPYLFLGLACGALVLLPIGASVFASARTIWGSTAGQRIVTKLRKRLYAHLHRLSLRFHQENRLGDLLLRITGDIPMLRDILSGSLIDLIGRIAALLLTLCVLIVIDPQLALVSVAVLIAVSALSGLFTRRIARVSKKQRRHEGILAYTAGETLTALAQVKALGREDAVIERFARQNRTSLRKGLKATRLQAALSRWVEIVFALPIRELSRPPTHAGAGTCGISKGPIWCRESQESRTSPRRDTPPPPHSQP